MKIVTRVEIKSSPERVFYWIERPERVKQWVTNVARSEYITETPERVGTTFREYIEEGGHNHIKYLLFIWRVSRIQQMLDSN